MSPLEQVLAASKHISDSGKVPSLALIKSKLGSSIPMPILIQGLQQFKSMPKSDICNIADLKLIDSAATAPHTEIDQLKQDITKLKLENRKLQARMDEIEKRLQGENK